MDGRAQSRIDGQGAFAAEAIPARRKIGEIRGEAISVREARRRAQGPGAHHDRRSLGVVRDRRLVPPPTRCATPTIPARPNASLRIRQGRVEIYALRDIAAGEEVLVDYGESHHEGRLRLPLRRAVLRRAAVTDPGAIQALGLGSPSSSPRRTASKPARFQVAASSGEGSSSSLASSGSARVVAGSHSST